MSQDKKSFRILIVDDEEQIIDVLRMNLEKRGYICDEASNGEEALEKIMDSPPDLLVTDIKMPKMDGLQLIENLKAEGIEIPVVVITAFFDIDNAIKALRLGAVNFFKKPFDFQNIHDTIFKIERLHAGKEEKNRALDYLETGRMKFLMPSDIELIDGISSYITDRAVDVGIVTKKQQFYTQLAIDEALSNAILHGNLNIQSIRDDKEGGKSRNELYNERLADPVLGGKRVTIEASVNGDKLEVVISDEGKGFDSGEIPDPTDNENVFRYHGRGIFVIKNIMDEVTFNESGNQITLRKFRQPSPTS